MNKTEKLILLLCLECVRSDDFSFDRYADGGVVVYLWYGNSIVKDWYIYPWQDDFNGNLIKAIKEIRAIKRGEK